MCLPISVQVNKYRIYTEQIADKDRKCIEAILRLRYITTLKCCTSPTITIGRNAHIRNRGH